MGACSTTTEALRKMGCKTSGGRLFCNDRAGGETLNHGHLPHNNRSHAEDGAQDIRGMSALRRPKRSGDRKTPGGRLFCNDRSGAETLDPWGLLYHDRSLAQDGASEVRGTSCHEPTEPEARP